MAGSYNPNAPATIGVEWDEATEGVTSLTTPTSVAAMLVTSTVTETVTAIYLPHTWTGPSTGYGKLVVDVYDLANALSTTLTTTRYAPTGDVSVTQMFGTSPAWTSLGAGSVYTKVDDGATYDDSDYLNFTWTGVARWKFGSAAVTGQVSSISFDVRAFGYYGTTPNVSLDLYNGSTFVSTLGTLAAPGNGDDTHKYFATYTFGPFTTNPLTGLAWTATDIANMSTGTNLLLQLTCNSGNTAVSWVSMKVVTGTDQRVATGSTALQTSLPSGTQTNLPCTLAANWSKVTGHTYLLVAKRLDDPAGLASTLYPAPIYMGVSAVPTLQGTEYSATVDSTGLLTAYGTAGTKTYGFWLAITAAQSVDSQPYYDVALKACHTSSTLKQGVAGASVQAYKGVTFLAALSATTPTASMSVKLKRTSDNVQFGGTATVATTDVTGGTSLGTITDTTYGALTVYRVMTNLASSATLAAATDYYLEFTSTTTSSAPFLIVELDGTATHTLTGNITYGGSTDQASIAGVGVPAADLVARISSTPVTPSSITVTIVAATANATTLDTAHLVWVNGGALGALFSRWDIDRSEDGGTTYVNIAKITAEATLTFDDYEGKRGTACKYRVRSVRTDGAVSDWLVETGTVTPTASTTGQTIFTTNASTTLTVGYTVFGVTTAYDFLSAGETVYMRLHNRDYQASFKPLEQRGISWSFDAMVNSSSAAPTGGRGVQAFTALRAIADSATPPYLCVHTADGERFFGEIQVAQGVREEPHGLYLAKVVFTQTQSTSSAVTV